MTVKNAGTVFSEKSVSYIGPTIALFKWKKWGFWGFAVSGFAILVVGIAGGYGIGNSLPGLIGLAVLYSVLHIGKENKGWPQLE